MNDVWYVFEGFAVNKGGVANKPVQSNGVRVNTSLIPFSCSNRVKDGSETDVDCGGDCNACSSGKTCSTINDCSSKICDDSTCGKSSCSDKIKNGDETDVDCGGKNCNDCSIGDTCSINNDCASSICSKEVCVVSSSSCSNNKKDGGETDVDCGGTCADSSNFKCATGKKCVENSDCAANLVCDKTVCVASSDSTVGSGGNNTNLSGSADGKDSEKNNDNNSGGGFPLRFVLPVIFLLILVGAVIGIKRYRQANVLFKPPLPSRNSFSRTPYQRTTPSPPLHATSRPRLPPPRPTPQLANKVREIPYLSGEKLFSQLKSEIVQKSSPGRKKRKL